MIKKLVWLHEKGLVFDNEILRNNIKKIYIWDDEYLRKRNYSLKKLVFIYETLSEMDIDIIYGNTLEILQSFEADEIFTTNTVDSEIKKFFNQISEKTKLIIAKNNNLVDFDEKQNVTRFFQYWNKAKKKVLDSDKRS